MKTVNILMGPKLGDLFHSLTVPSYYWTHHGIKTNFFITDKYDDFTTTPERTFKELQPIIESQEYINHFGIFDPSKDDFDHDLNMFRFNGLLYTRSFWAVFLHSAFPDCPVIPKNYVSVDVPTDDTYKDYLLVHRKPGRFEWTDVIEKQYRHVMDQFDKKLFISFSPYAYDNFELKDEIEFLEIEDLYEYLKIIKGCKNFLTNATGTLCMATAINSPRIGELGKFLTPHYSNDHLFFDNCEFFDQQGVYTPDAKFLDPNIK
jgi:hypothetical protein